MCAKLGIELIGANSPQAKGRVERGHGTHQDRFIKKMRLKKIATYDQANRFLAESYLEGHNARYAVVAREPADFHQAPAGLDLAQVGCLEEQRKVSNDWVVQYGQRWLQVEAEGQRALVAAGSSVVVWEHRDGRLTLLRGSARLRWHELSERPWAKQPAAKPRVVTHRKPAPEHPWRKPYLAAQAR
jgi:hypothetical protein